MENINIRNVEKKDIKQIAAIRVNGWKKAYKGIIDDTYLEELNIYENMKIFTQRYYQDDEGFIVAESDNQVVGFARYINHNRFSPEVKEVDCELLALYVLPAMKRNGVGKKLLEYVKNEFVKQNKKRMILWCLKENYPSRKFYERVGGKLSIERKIKIGEKDYDEVSFIYMLQKEDEVK